MRHGAQDVFDGVDALVDEDLSQVFVLFLRLVLGDGLSLRWDAIDVTVLPSDVVASQLV